MDDYVNHPDFHFIEGSVTDTDLLARCIDGCQYVYHGAVRGIGISTQRPAEEMAVNIGGTLNVLEACRQHSDSIRKILIPSSASVYGEPSQLPEHEQMVLEPRSPYGVSKLAAEKYALCYRFMFGLPTVTLRYFNTYGPRQRSDSVYGGVIPIFLDRILKGKPIEIYGDGNQSRDFTFIDDCVEITLRFLLGDHLPDGPVNIGTGIETSVNDIAGALEEIHSAEVATSHIAPRLVDNINRRCASVEFLLQNIDEIEFTPLADGLRKTYASALSNRP
jgi:UDP-glucose 4-epimerase